MRKILVCVSFPIVVLCQAKVPAETRLGYDWLTEKNLKSHLSVLSSDSLEGRETSFPGQQKAARYIAQTFKRAGLRPLGPNGSFFQSFTVDAEKTSDRSSITVSAGGTVRTFRWLDNYIAFGGPETTVSGPAVFVGFMDTKFDSAVVDRFRGRVVVALAGSRGELRDTSGVGLRRRMLQFRSDKGSLATLVICDAEGTGSFPRLASFMRGFVEKGSMRLKGQEGRGSSFRSVFYYVSDELAQTVFHRSPASWSKLRETAQDSAFSPIFLDSLSIRISHVIDREQRATENVIGVLDGRDSVLKNEFVFLTAHYDHLGKFSDGSVYHGADDDGSGTSALMTLAEAFARNKVRSKRSMVFLAVTGEEKGLLGSTFYTNNPLVPLDRTMADLNIDMIGRTDPEHDSLQTGPYVYVIGSDKISSELDQVLIQANHESENIDLDYRFNDENDPNQFYRRSDHYNFAKNGIPIAFFFTGEHKDYHKPTDTIDRIRFDRMAKITRLIFLTAWKAAHYPRLFVKDAEGSL